jgi:hypothetical protein
VLAALDDDRAARRGACCAALLGVRLGLAVNLEILRKAQTLELRATFRTPTSTTS